MDGIDGDEALYAERDRLVRELVESAAHLKVIVAGPGTGKTRAFRELLTAKAGDKIALTFINNLVIALQRDLGDLAQVQTLHGFARALLHRHGALGVSHGCDYYPSLTEILRADATIVLGRAVDYWDIEGVLHEMQDGSDIVESAMASGSYYDATGHTDSVYRVVQYLRVHPEDVPRFAQVVVDEFQDFSLLEVTLIGELSELSPTLVVGDDDQALYEFKHARADYLRDVVAKAEHARFDLPFCSRCPEVLVEGLHRVVAEAQRTGLLAGRVDKRYECFTPTKRADSERYPKIVHAECSVERNNAPYICRYVEEQIGAIPPEDVAASTEGDYPTALVMGPPQFSSRVACHLIERGVPNVTPPRSARRELDLLDAYRRVARRPRSRLGWRILVHLANPGDREAIVRRALEGGEEIVDLLPAEYREAHLTVAAFVAKVRADEPLDDHERAELESALARPLDEIRLLLGVAEEDVEGAAPAVEGAPTVAITTLEGAKGLQAAHVFVVGANERHFPRSNAAPDDHEVCCMLVALTRATKCCHLVSCRRFGEVAVRPSVFIAWLGDLVEPLTVDANYFARATRQ